MKAKTKFAKRIVSLVLVIMMVFATFSISASAYSGSVSMGEDYTYYYDTEILYVTDGYHISVDDNNSRYVVKSGDVFSPSVKISLGTGSSVGGYHWKYSSNGLTVWSGTFDGNVFSGIGTSKITVDGGNLVGGNFPNAEVTIRSGKVTGGTYGTIYAASADMVGENVTYSRLVIGYLANVTISGTYQAGKTITATAISSVGEIPSSQVSFSWWCYEVDFMGYWNTKVLSTSNTVTLPNSAVGMAIYLDVYYNGQSIQKDLGPLPAGSVGAHIDYVNSSVVFTGDDGTMIVYKTDPNADYQPMFSKVIINNGKASCSITDGDAFLSIPVRPGDTLYYAVAVETGKDMIGFTTYSYGATKSIKVPERNAYSGPTSVQLTSTEDTVTIVDAPTGSSLQYGISTSPYTYAFPSITSQDGKFTDLTPGTTYYVFARNVSSNKLSSTITSLGSIDTKTPALAVVTVEQDAPLTYNGSPQGASVKVNMTEVDGKEVTVTYSAVKKGEYGAMPQLTDVGTYTLYYKVSAEGYNDYIGEFTVTIDKAVVDVPTIESKVFDGVVLTADVPASDLYTVTSNNGGTACGEFDVVLTLVDSNNYKWATTEEATITLPFIITKAENSWTTTPSIAGWTYGENASTPVYGEKFGTVTVKYTGTANDGTTWDSSDSPVKAGEYKASFTVEATDNYSGLEKTVDFTVEKANYDMTNAQWNYADAFTYDGLEKTVAVQGLPEGVTAEYTGEKATAVGVYTAKATLAYDSNNYNAPEIADLEWKIENNWDASEFVVTQLNENNYTDIDFTVVAEDGYLLSLGNTDDSTWENMLTVTEETEDGSLTFYVRNQATKEISLAKTVSFKIDKTAPAGKVYFDERNGWETFLNNITFGLFYKEEVIVKADSNDNLSGVESVEYLAGDKALTLDEAMESSDWQTMAENGVAVTFEDAKQFVYYVRITDKAGNVTYLSTDGAEYDNTAPVISGVENSKTYYTTQKVTVADKNIESITLNGEAVGEAVTLDGNKEATYTIVATDKAGNTATVTVTMKPVSDLSKAIDDVNAENVNSDNQQTINDVKDAVNAVDTTNATDVEKEALKAIADKADKLQKVIDDTNAEIQRVTEELKKYDKDTVTSEDVTELEKIGNDIKALTDGGNLSAEEREALTKAAEDVEKMDKTVEDTVAKNSQIAEELAKFNKDTVNSDASEAMTQLLESINTQLESTNLTEAERQTLEESKTAVTEMQKTVEDTVAKNTQIAEELAKFNKDTVNSDASEAVTQLLESINTQLESTNLTEAEKQTLTETKATVEEMLKIIDDTTTQIGDLTADIGDFKKNTVKADDKVALVQIVKDVDSLLNTENLTEDEKTTLENIKDKAESLLNTIKVNYDADAFELLSVKQKKATKTSITITWNQYKGAKKYIIYGSACGRKYKKLKTITKTSFTNKELKSGKYYKFYIVAVDSNGVELEKSNRIHISTSGNKNKANPTAITVNSDNVTINGNKTFTVKANVKNAKDTVVKKHSDIKYVSTNKKVAKVSADGVITGKQAGSCYVYVYAQNGIAKKIKVTVE